MAEQLPCYPAPANLYCPRGSFLTSTRCPPRANWCVRDVRPGCHRQGYLCATAPRVHLGALRRRYAMRGLGFLGQALGALWSTGRTSARRAVASQRPDLRRFDLYRDEPGAHGGWSKTGYRAAMAFAHVLMNTPYSKPSLIRVRMRQYDMVVAAWADCGQGWVEMVRPAPWVASQR
jgi:hypothetical protein